MRSLLVLLPLPVLPLLRLLPLMLLLGLLPLLLLLGLLPILLVLLVRLLLVVMLIVAPPLPRWLGPTGGVTGDRVAWMKEFSWWHLYERLHFHGKGNVRRR